MFSYNHYHLRNEYVLIQSTENGQTVWSTQPTAAIQLHAKGDQETLFKAALEAFNLAGDDRVIVIEPSDLGGRGVVDIFGKDILEAHAKEMARVAAYLAGKVAA